MISWLCPWKPILQTRAARRAEDICGRVLHAKGCQQHTAHLHLPLISSDTDGSATLFRSLSTLLHSSPFATFHSSSHSTPYCIACRSAASSPGPANAPIADRKTTIGALYQMHIRGIFSKEETRRMVFQHLHQRQPSIKPPPEPAYSPKPPKVQHLLKAKSASSPTPPITKPATSPKAKLKKEEPKRQGAETSTCRNVPRAEISLCRNSPVP